MRYLIRGFIGDNAHEEHTLDSQVPALRYDDDSPITFDTHGAACTALDAMRAALNCTTSDRYAFRVVDEGTELRFRDVPALADLFNEEDA